MSWGSVGVCGVDARGVLCQTLSVIQDWEIPLIPDWGNARVGKCHTLQCWVQCFHFQESLLKTSPVWEDWGASKQHPQVYRQSKRWDASAQPRWAVIEIPADVIHYGVIRIYAVFIRIRRNMALFLRGITQGTYMYVVFIHLYITCLYATKKTPKSMKTGFFFNIQA